MAQATCPYSRSLAAPDLESEQQQISLEIVTVHQPFVVWNQKQFMKSSAVFPELYLLYTLLKGYQFRAINSCSLMETHSLTEHQLIDFLVRLSLFCFVFPIFKGRLEILNEYPCSILMVWKNMLFLVNKKEFNIIYKSTTNIQSQDAMNASSLWNERP